MATPASQGKFFKVLNAGTFGYKRMPKDIRAALARVVDRHIRIVRDKIRMAMRARKHGRVYYINGKRHRASAPGEAPAILTGALYRSIVPRISASKTQARIAPKVFYAHWLERGTKRGHSKFSRWRMRPRPYMKPAFDSQREEFRASVARAVQRVMNQRAKRRREA